MLYKVYDFSVQITLVTCFPWISEFPNVHDCTNLGKYGVLDMSIVHVDCICILYNFSIWEI